MRSIPLAMTWELLWRGRWTLPAAALAANALPALLFTALAHERAFDPADPSLIIMNIVLMQMNAFVFGAAVIGAAGHPSRLYAFPAPTSALVAWHMLPAMALLALESLASTAAMNAVFHLGWPLWGPAMFLAVAMAVVEPALWLTEKSAWLALAMAAVGTVLGLWNKARYGPTFSQPTHMWSEVTPGEVATMLAFGVAAYGAAIVGMARNRRGDRWPPLGIVAWFKRVLDPAPDLGLPFSTPVHAQLWFEWRRKGALMPVAVVFCLLAAVGGWLIFSRDPQALFAGFIAGGACLSWLGMIGGLIVGNIGSNDSNYEIGSFLATRPLSSADLARSILKTAARSVFLAWAIWAAALLVLWLILLATGAEPRPALSSGLGWWYFPATLLGPWIVVTLLAAAGLTGRSTLLVKLFFGFLVLFIGSMLVSKFTLSHQAQLQLGRAIMAAGGVALVPATAWTFAVARRRALIGSQTLIVAASLWAAMVALVMLETRFQPAMPLAVYAFAAGLLALAIAPLATAPLAVAWNRNR